MKTLWKVFFGNWSKLRELENKGASKRVMRGNV